MTIVAGNSRNFPGYRIDCTEQIGCGSTDDDPSEEILAAADTNTKKVLDRIAADVARAWDIYSGKGHPFTLVHRHLAAGGPSESEHIPWQGAEVYLRARAGTAPIVQKKLMVDVLLSLTTDPDLARRSPHLRTYGAPEPLAYPLTADHLLPALIAKAGRGDAELRAFAATPEPADESALQRWLHARALQHAIDGTPYGPLVDSARRLAGDRPGLSLLLFAGAAQAPELPAILEAFGPAGRATAGPLLS